MKNHYYRDLISRCFFALFILTAGIVSGQPCAVPPTATAGNDASICAGSSYTLGGTIGGSATSATWSGGTGSFSPSDAFGVATSYIPSAGDISAGSVVITLTTDDPDGAG